MNERILVIDDSPTLRKLLRFYLKKKGYEVHEAHNGKVGLEAIDEKNFDLVILDLNMPVMDGFKVLKALKNKEDFSLVFLGHKIPFNRKVLRVFEVLRQYLREKNEKRYRCYYEERDLTLSEKLSKLRKCIIENRTAGYKINDDFLRHNFDQSFISHCIESNLLIKLPNGEYDFSGEC